MATLMLRKLVPLMPLLLSAIVLTGFAGRFIGGGSSGNSLSTSMVFVNAGGSTMAAGTPTQIFGQIFKQGDVPTGTWPVFTDPSNGHVQPQSYGLDTYYEDGSLKHATFMLLPDFSVTSGSSKTINITGGGSKPAASGRAVSDINAQNCKIVLPPAPVTGSNLGGVTNSAWLDTTDTNTYKTVQWMDGAAGAAWRVSAKMAVTKGGTANTHLAADFYVMALNNSSAGLGGFRILPMARNPWYNAASAQDWYFFAAPDYGTPTNGPNWNCAGTATPLAWHGGDNAAMLPQVFTVNTGVCNTCFSTTATNNYWSGGASGNIFPFYLTTSGGATLPVGADANGAVTIDTNVILFAQSNNAAGGTGPNSLSLYTAPEQNSQRGLTLTTNGSGTFTIHPVPGVGPFTKLAFANNDANYNFFQGSGSLASESTLRAKFDQLYWHSTKMLPPWNLSVQGASNGGIGANAVLDVTTPSDWNEFNITDWHQDQQTGGENSHVGPYSYQQAVDFYNQSAASLKAIRIGALAANLGPFDIKDAATDMVVNLLDTPGATSHTGLPNSVRDTFLLNPSSMSFPYVTTYKANGPGFDGFQLNSAYIAEHRPNYAIYPFIRDGSLHQLDAMRDVANEGLGYNLIADRNPTTPLSPMTSYAIFLNGSLGNEIRAQAHAFRDIMFTANLYPYDATGAATGIYTNGGTQEAKYFRDIMFNNTAFVGAALNPANNAYGTSTSYFLDPSRKMWVGGHSYTGYGNASVAPTFELYYLDSYMLTQYAMYNDANTLTWIQAWGTAQTYITNTFGGYHLYGYINHPGEYAGNNGVTTMIEDDDHWAIVTGGGTIFSYQGGPMLSWTTTSPAFSLQASALAAHGYVPSAGDIMQFQNIGGFPKPANFSYELQAYYIPSAPTLSGGNYHFDLKPCNGGGSGKLCTGGSVLLPSVAGDDGGFGFGVPDWIRMANPPAAASGFHPAFANFEVMIQAGGYWATALGISGYTAPLADVNTRMASSPTGEFASPFPAQGDISMTPKYIMQPCFGVRTGNPLAPCP